VLGVNIFPRHLSPDTSQTEIPGEANLTACGDGVFCCGASPGCNCVTGEGTFIIEAPLASIISTAYNYSESVETETESAVASMTTTKLSMVQIGPASMYHGIIECHFWTATHSNNDVPEHQCFSFARITIYLTFMIIPAFVTYQFVRWWARFRLLRRISLDRALRQSISAWANFLSTIRNLSCLYQDEQDPAQRLSCVRNI
jgi:hypothetical protein